jgi:hypothetical protein
VADVTLDQFEAVTAEELQELSPDEQNEFMSEFRKRDPAGLRFKNWYSTTTARLEQLAEEQDAMAADTQRASREADLGGQINEGLSARDYQSGPAQFQVGKIEEKGRALAYMRQQDPTTEFEAFDNPDGSYGLYWRQPGTREWNPFNAPGASTGDVASTLGALATPGMAADVALGTGITAATGGLGTLPMIAVRAGLSGASAAGTRAMDEALFEPGQQTGEQIADKALESGAVATALSPIGDLAGTVGRYFSGGKPQTVSPAVDRWQQVNAQVREENTRAQARLASELETALAEGDNVTAARIRAKMEDPGIAELTAGEAGVSPAQRSAEQFLSGVDPAYAERAIEREAAPRRRLLDLAGDGRLPLISRQDLDVLVRDEKGKALEALRRRLNEQGMGLEEATPSGAGRLFDRDYQGVVEGLREQGRRRWIDALDYARTGGFEFNIAPFIDEVRAVREMPEYQAVDAPAIDIASIGTAQSQTLPWQLDYRNDFKQLFAKIDTFNELQPSERVDVLEAIRKELQAIGEKEPGLLASGQSKEVAGRLLKSLIDSMEQAGDGTFKRKLDEARVAWRDMSQLQRTFQVVVPPNQQDAVYGSRVYRELLGGRNYEDADGANLAFRIMSPEARTSFQNAFFNDMIQNPDKLDGVVSALGARRGRLIPAPLVDALEVWRDQIKRIDEGVIARAANNATDTYEQNKVLLDSDDVQTMQRLIHDGAFTRDELRGTILARAVDNATDLVDNVPRLNATKFRTELDRLRKTKAYGLLDDASKRALETTEALMSFVESGGAMAEGLAAGALRQRMQNVPLAVATGGASLVHGRARVWGPAFVMKLTQNPRYLRYIGAEGAADRPAWSGARSAVMLAATAFPRIAGSEGTEQRARIGRDPVTGQPSLLVDEEEQPFNMADQPLEPAQ